MSVLPSIMRFCTFLVFATASATSVVQGDGDIFMPLVLSEKGIPQINVSISGSFENAQDEVLRSERLMIFDTSLQRSSSKTENDGIPDQDNLIVHIRNPQLGIGASMNIASFNLGPLGPSGRDELQEEFDILGAGRSSNFVHAIPSFMILPPPPPLTRPMLVLNPTSPDRYCFADQMVYLDGVENIRGREWFVNMMVSIIQARDVETAVAAAGQPTDYQDIWVHVKVMRMSTGSEFDELPWNPTVRALHDLIQRTGAIIETEQSGEYHLRTVVRGCEDHLADFPSLKYSMFKHARTPEGARRLDRLEKALDILLEPAAYVKMLPNGDCILQIESFTHRRVDGVGTLGMNIFNLMNVHFDAVNDKIGFCDPKDWDSPVTVE